MEKDEIIKYIDSLQSELALLMGRAWACRWVDARMEFHRLFMGKLIVSTVHGADFFDNVMNCLTGKMIWDTKIYKGEYEDNFREFLKSIK